MSLKARLRISIVALVAIVVVALSALYLYDFSAIAFEGAAARADLVASQVKSYVLERIRDETAVRQAHPADLAQSKQLWTDIVRTDPQIPAMLTRTVAHEDLVLNIQISGEDGTLLTASGPAIFSAQDFSDVQKRNAFRNLWDLLAKPEDFARTLPLSSAGQSQPIFRITIMVRSTLLREALKPAFQRLGVAFFGALAFALVLGFALPSVVLHPLERLGKRIDLIRTGEFEAAAPVPQEETEEFAVVQSKLNMLGQQFRGAKQDALALRANIEEMLQRLEEAVFLFDTGGRLMMAGAPAERLLEKTHNQILGSRVEELFPAGTILGTLIHKAMRDRQPVRDEVVTMDGNGNGRARLLLNVEVIRNRPGIEGQQQEIGTLITLRDAESRRQLELQLDVSSRLAAISRLTGGVAHEIKNPLNAMALHLEVLKSKLDAEDPEIAVISNEIKRLDSVVKTFLNFTKPIEVLAKPLNITALTVEVLTLIEPEAKSKSVTFEMRSSEPRWINGDPDLLKQAVLNVVVNAVEAMESGGRLTAVTSDAGGECTIEISDNGPGIPADIQDKIYNLYFSTKKTGSGIGLAMTFRVVQLHGGTIDVSSEPGRGTSFRLHFPALQSWDDARAVRRAHS